MIEFVKLWWKPILAGVVLLYFAIVAIGKIHAYGQRQYQDGRNAVIAENAAATEKDKRDADTHAADSAQAGVDLHTTLDIALPKIEVTTHDTAAKITTIYLAQPVDGPACVRPPGVQTELDAALRAANAAADRQL